MIISDLYRTEMFCSNYNPIIDTTGIMITVRLIDFNNNVVPNKEVRLSVDRGTLTEVSVGGNPTISSDGKSVSVRTNESGEAKVKYTANAWGLCTFTANGNNIQVNVRGWKTVFSNTDEGVVVRTNGMLGEIIWSRASKNIPKGTTTIVTIPTAYVPVKIISMWGHYNSSSAEVSLNTDGKFEVHNLTGKAKTMGLFGNQLYRLANPTY